MKSNILRFPVKRRGKSNGRQVVPFVSCLAILVGILCAPVSALADQETKTVSLKEALEITIQKHPRIIAADLQSLIAKQSLREARSSYFPSIHADATWVGTPTERNQIISAGALAVSSTYDREAEGISINQLITDFGRTANLAAGSKSHSHAQEQSALATRAQIELAVRGAYFAALQAQSVLEVAKQTVATRQLLFDQVSEMAKNNLKSGLDESFADVDLEDSKLLLANAENDLQAGFARLANLLGEPNELSYRLKEEPLPPRGASNTWDLVQTALKNRPEIAQLRFELEAANDFAHAEKDLNYPIITAAASAGVLPIHNQALPANYAAAGINVRLPIFDGWLYSAREKEAQLKAKVAVENLQDIENNVIQDVRIAATNQGYAAARLDLTAKLMASANKAFDLAQQSYQVGSSSIIELSQAQLNQTEARINQAKATYEFQIRSAILTYQLGGAGAPL